MSENKAFGDFMDRLIKDTLSGKIRWVPLRLNAFIMASPLLVYNWEFAEYYKTNFGRSFYCETSTGTLVLVCTEFNEKRAMTYKFDLRAFGRDDETFFYLSHDSEELYRLENAINSTRDKKPNDERAQAFMLSYMDA